MPPDLTQGEASVSYSSGTPDHKNKYDLWLLTVVVILTESVKHVKVSVTITGSAKEVSTETNTESVTTQPSAEVTVT
jgi:hypothetical protein